MPLPAWMHNYPGGPKPAVPTWVSERLAPEANDKTVGITSCVCRGEGCTACDGDGVIYP
ncbi:hypothetical protein OG571_47285 (plasmid) [Streptomyces sp. NBC_01369]|uniref:hypothetical protein n=1 Tax=Streptomyces sp. NBC_01369 TaxID=2903842 RepID=UPI002F91A107